MISLNLNDEFEARVANHLAHNHIVWLTTVDAVGVPQPAPVGFVWDGQTLLVYSKPKQAKLRNIAANPCVSLNFNGDPDGHDIVVLHGTAAIDPSAPPAIANPAYLAKYGRAFEGFHLSPESFSAQYAVAVRVVPDSVPRDLIDERAGALGGRKVIRASSGLPPRIAWTPAAPWRCRPPLVRSPRRRAGGGSGAPTGGDACSRST